MALPESYNNTETYLKDCLQFLKDHHWIYNYPNTHILVYKVFDQMPQGWVECFNNFTSEDLNNLALGCANDFAPSSLKDFLRKVDTLKPNVEVYCKPDDFDFPKNISIGMKKRHEITCLSPLVHRVCEEKNVSSLLDIGCGLGYLPHLLNEKYNYTVFGVEGDEEKFKSAKEYQKKYYQHSLNNVTYLHHYITINSLEILSEVISNEACVMGLHACADLSVTILDLFERMSSAKCLVVMPCCYHRLALKSRTGASEDFENFPSSDVLKNIFVDFSANLFLRRPFLRLASQQSNERWRTMDDAAHDVHAKNCLFRAILQEIAEEGGYEIRRLRRKSGKSTGGDGLSLETFVNNLSTTHSFTSSNRPVDCSEIRAPFSKKWNNYQRHLAVTEALTCLQTTIQAVCENLVLLDRVEYLKQKGLHATVYKVTDERLSPRCFALVATKH